MSNNDWYRFYAPRRLDLTPERIAADCAAAERDIDALLARTGLQPSDRVLEIGCGWGRHALALAERGFRSVESIDIAPEPLVIARALAGERGLDCTFRQQDFMAVDDGPLDAVISLYDRSVCGFPSESEDERSLRHLAALIRPGGWLVFGINDWPFHLPEPRRDWRETTDGIEFLEVLPDRTAMTCTDRTTLVRPDGRREHYELTRRHYYVPELRRICTEAGLDIRTVLHRMTEERPYGDGGNGMFVFARRMG
jgi:SAM-dependent methyltransferase